MIINHAPPLASAAAPPFGRGPPPGPGPLGQASLYS